MTTIARSQEVVRIIVVRATQALACTVLRRASAAIRHPNLPGILAACYYQSPMYREVMYRLVRRRRRMAQPPRPRRIHIHRHFGAPQGHHEKHHQLQQEHYHPPASCSDLTEDDTCNAAACEWNEATGSCGEVGCGSSNPPCRCRTAQWETCHRADACQWNVTTQSCGVNEHAVEASTAHNQCKWPVQGPIYFNSTYRSIQFGEKDDVMYMIVEERETNKENPVWMFRVGWDETLGCVAYVSSITQAYYLINCDDKRNTYTLTVQAASVDATTRVFTGLTAGETMEYSLRSFSGQLPTVSTVKTIGNPATLLLPRDITQFIRWPWAGNTIFVSPHTACSSDRGVRFQLTDAQPHPSATKNLLAPNYVVIQGCTDHIIFFWNTPSRSESEKQHLIAKSSNWTHPEWQDLSPAPWGQDNTPYPVPFLFTQRTPATPNATEVARPDSSEGGNTHTTEYRYWSQDYGLPLGVIVNGIPTYCGGCGDEAYAQVGLTYITAKTDYNGRGMLNITNSYFGSLEYNYDGGGCIETTAPGAAYWKPPTTNDITHVGAVACGTWY